MIMRDLTGPLQSEAISDLIQSILVSECIHPSQPLWFLSGWISDIEVVDNTTRAFALIDPEWPATKLRLSQVLKTILVKDGHVSVVLRDVDHNQYFLGKLADLKKEFSSQLRIYLGEHEHQKGIVGQNFCLDGSMNFTRHGIQINGEHLIFRTDPQVVSTRRIDLSTQWYEVEDGNF